MQGCPTRVGENAGLERNHEHMMRRVVVIDEDIERENPYDGVG